MALSVTTRERVKRRLGQPDPTATDTQMDTLLDALIPAVSAAIELHVQLPLLAEEQTEVHSADQWQSDIWLRTYFGAFMAVPTITSVKTRARFTEDWSDALDPDTYALASDYPGLLLYDRNFPAGRDTVQVVLASSGFAATTAAFITAYPAIVDAADAQIAYEYDRRKNPGQSTTTTDGATRTQREVRLLTSVRERLQPYVRVHL